MFVSTWFSTDDGKKGAIAAGQLADLAVLSADYFAVADEHIKDLEAVLTVVDGRVVYGGKGFESEGPGELPVSPDWSPVNRYGGYQGPVHHARTCLHHDHGHGHAHVHSHEINVFHGVVDRAKRWLEHPFGTGLGCDCFAF